MMILNFSLSGWNNPEHAGHENTATMLDHAQHCSVSWLCLVLQLLAAVVCSRFSICLVFVRSKVPQLLLTS